MVKGEVETDNAPPGISQSPELPRRYRIVWLPEVNQLTVIVEAPVLTAAPTGVLQEAVVKGVKKVMALNHGEVTLPHLVRISME